ncbi:MAG: ABC transporter substrate-binding protein [Clostridia bacterium]|jgi:putative ABC transport system substrate-binding protein|nr:ABC transporter substrate-binding protein [Clostridia bacterium]MDH7573195.1 ABC transporter substrate-binding protein [Clostridia bacterium]
MRKIKAAAVLALVVLLIAAAGGCGSQPAQQQSQTPPAQEPAQPQEPVKLGIIQIVEHPSLDQARKGFLDVLAERGYKDGEKLAVDYQNAQGDMTTANTIAKKFVSDQKDLVLAIATPVAQAMANATKEIPILITAVTDPVAAGLVQSLEKPNTNVTGTTDMNPVKEQLALFKDLDPQAKKIGFIYNSSEVNSRVQLDMAKEAAPELGYELVEAVVTNSSDVLQAARTLADKVDGIYVPTDNTVVSALESVISVAEEKDLPLVVGEGDSVKRGGLATVGIDYYQLGRQTGEMAIRILEQGAKPQDMPIEAQKEYQLILNKKAAANMGVTLSESLLSRAAEVYE